MAKFRGAVVVNEDYCKGCELCVEACPQKVLAMSPKVNSKGYHFSMMEAVENCIGCMACGMVCPDACIAVYKVRVEDAA
ncbi:MAG: 4Fe-4S binding protein [Prevotellaceae bacterium]|jgi:2-oxoglutarate ferredoxin oxidoreductase subunit delta|nr:4Fe-4S binding protein [Prevotellaceae bacterium]